MEEIKQLSDYIDIDLLQTIQDDCSKAMGLAFITVDYKGIPITRYSSFTEHCELGRRVKGFAELCEQCDAHGGLHAAITGQPYIYRCHADLVDFAVPLIVNGSYMGAVLGGQVRLKDESEKELEYILHQKNAWRDHNPELDQAYHDLEVVTYEKVEAAVKVLRDIVLSVIRWGDFQPMEQKLREKDRQISEERAARSDLERTIQKQKLSSGDRKAELRQFFYVMNIISKLAYEEKAPKTEMIAYDFADMMRYDCNMEQKISTVGEELGYIGALLRIRKAWVQDKLSYAISVPEQYRQVPCPFMVLRPIVEYALEGLEVGGTPPRKLEFVAERDGSSLLFTVLSSDTTRSVAETEAEASGPMENKRYSLEEADHLLKRTLGIDSGLLVSPRQDGNPGVAVGFRLPMERAT